MKPSFEQKVLRKRNLFSVMDFSCFKTSTYFETNYNIYKLQQKAIPPEKQRCRKTEYSGAAIKKCFTKKLFCATAATLRLQSKT